MTPRRSAATGGKSRFYWGLILGGSLAVAACAPAPPPASGPGATGETTGTAAADRAPAVTADYTSMTIEHRWTPHSADAKVPFPDADIAEDITPGKRGGTFTTSSFGDGPKTFDPVTANESSSNEVIAQMFAGLIGFDPVTQAWKPGLLKEWFMEEEDKSVWTLRLREGIKWSDGHPITAEDIVFTAEVLYDPNIPNAAKDVLSIDGKPFEFTKLDDQTVRVKLAAPSGSFHVLMASFQPVPKHVWEEVYKAGNYNTAMNISTPPEQIVCSGPFKLRLYQSGERVVLERNPHYFRYDINGVQLPYLDTLIYSYAPDQDQQLLRFKTGQIDGYERIRAEAIPDLRAEQQQGNFTLYDLGPGLGSNLFWFNLKLGENKESGRPYVDPVRMAWFQDRRFRQAVMHALDIDSAIRTELRGQAVRTWSLMSPILTFWYYPDTVTYEFDKEKSGQILDEMGLKDHDGDGWREDPNGNRVSFTFITNKGNKARENISALFAADLKEIGIDARPQFVEFNTLVTLTADTFEYEACLLGLGGGGIHPALSMNVYKSSGQTHLHNPKQETPQTEWEAEIDRLAERFNATLDALEQQRIMWEIQRIWSEEIPILPLFTTKVFAVARNTFGNIRPSPVASYELMWNADEFFVK